VFGVAVFPDNATLEIADVAVNMFLDNAPAVFQLSALVEAFQKGIPGRENRRLTPSAVDLVAYQITGSAELPGADDENGN